MQAVALGLGTPSPVAGSVPVLPNAQAGLAPVPTAGVGAPLHGCLPPALGGLCPWGAVLGELLPKLWLCFCCSFMGSFGFFLFLTFFGPDPGGCLYPARWQHAWSPVCAMG